MRKRRLRFLSGEIMVSAQDKVAFGDFLGLDCLRQLGQNRCRKQSSNALVVALGCHTAV